MDTGSISVERTADRPRILVIGNMKGGTGKSTIAVHLAVALLYKGYAVGALDLDTEQQTITRYFANRRAWRSLDPLALTGSPRRFPSPRLAELETPGMHTLRGEEAAARRAFRKTLAGLSDCDFIVIDTPGSTSTLSQIAHRFADVLVTPINDSLVDIDVLADIDTASRTVVAPSRYSRMVMNVNDRRVAAGGAAIDWVLVRNRLAHVESRNRRDIEQVLSKLSQRLGFRQIAGIGERVVYREHFPTGLTVLDLPKAVNGRSNPASRLAALNEIGSFVESVCYASRVVPVADLAAV